MYDKDIHLVVSIFQQAIQYKGHEERDQAKYVKRHATKIKDAGLMFNYLGLAEPDDNSPIGWKPTHRMMEVIALRASKPKSSRASGKEDFLIEYLYTLSFGESKDRADFAFEFLKVIGLLRSDDCEGCWVSTLQLKELFKQDQSKRFWAEYDAD